jgi:AraC-like DNA-binding protein
VKRIIDSIRKKSTLIYWVLSYLTIVFISITISTVVYLQSYNIITSEINRANEAILRQVRQNLDSRMNDIEKICVEFSLNDKITGLINSRKPLDDNTRYLISTIVNKDLKTIGLTNNFVKDMYIYFKRGDFVLRSSAYYELEQAYMDFYKESALSYENWTRIIVDRYFKDIISVADDKDGSIDQINYIHSIGAVSSDSYANLVFILEPKSFLETLKGVEWINNGCFFILDKDNTVVMSNMDANNINTELSYDKYKNEYGTIRNRESMVSYIKSKNMDWIYVSVIPTEVFMEKASIIRNITLLSFALCIFLGGIISFIFSKKNYMPISEILDTLRTKKSPSNKKVPKEFQMIQQSIYETLLEKDRLKSALTSYNDVMRNSFLLRLLKGKLYEKEYQEDVLNYYNINFVHENFAVILFKVECLGKFQDSSGVLGSGEMQEGAKFVISNVMQEVIASKYKCYMTDVDDCVVAILNIEKDELKDIKAELFSLLINGKDFIKNNFNIVTTIAVSNMQKSRVGIPIAYQQAIEALEYKLVRGKGEMISYGEIINSKFHYSYSLQTELHLINNLKAGNLNQCMEIVQAIFDNFYKDDTPGLEIIKISIIDLISTIIKVIEELDINDEDLRLDKLVSLRKILSYESVSELYDLIEEVVVKICNKISGSRKSHNDVLKDSIIKFIDENYDKLQLSNTLIADKLNISTAYLSRFFKEQTGESLLEYINKVRLTHAKAVLKDEKCTIEDAAKKVGLNNDIALIRIFKRYEGITPGKFKENIMHEHN